MNGWKSKRRAFGAAAVAVGLISAASDGSQVRDSDKPRKTLLAIHVAAEFIEAHAAEHFTFPGPTNGLVPLATLRRSVGSLDPKLFAEKDAWGKQLLYWSDGLEYMILSLGADNTPDYDYQLHEIPYEEIPPGMTRSPDEDIILINDDVLRGPVIIRRRPRATIGDMRSIATACEEYSIDNNYYPHPSSSLVQVSALARDLTPVYIKKLPIVDVWDQPYFYWCNGANYVIISTGADETADAPYEQWRSDEFLSYYGGPVPDLRRDIIFRTGQFVQYPSGTTP